LRGPVSRGKLFVGHLELDRTVTRMVFDLRAVSIHRDDEADRAVRRDAKTSEWQTELEHATRRGLNIRTVQGGRLSVRCPLEHTHLRRPAVSAHGNPEAA